MAKEFVILLCLVGVAFAAVVQNSQPIESNAAAVAGQINPEEKTSNDDSSDLETAEFKHFGRRFGFGVPVAVPLYVQPVPVQPVAVPVAVPVQPIVQPIVQPVQYQHGATETETESEY
ncbi:hypothetical protein Bhyg_09429 [Pseudolycoriella hygida]|uniref:Uncharacterized protein n=1 Tax=Pseudolycoriella hygida TaxID=35572 RepID=A0A9Q0S5W6_9DIPT|nr:hypothetical protein Bhyg_09429 [Pseudolycoriella hygida]